MTTTFLTPATHPSVSDPIRPLRFLTLAKVELRKMTDTRSGRWVLASILAVSATVLGFRLTQSNVDPSFRTYGGAVATIIAFFAPIVGLLAMTSEWTQRSALTTFTLAPRRLPVLAAKYLSALIVSLGLFVAGVVMSLGATALGGLIHGGADYGSIATDVRGFAIIVVLQVTMAAAFGALAAQSAVALVAYFVAPTAFAALSSNLLHGASPWFDVFSAYDQLASEQPFHHLPQSLTAICLWVVLPSAIGIVRSLRREVK